MLRQRFLLWLPVLVSIVAFGSLSAPSQAGEWFSFGPGSTVTGSGHVIDEVRPVAPFGRLRVDGPFQVQVRAAASTTLRVRADDNLVPLVRTTVEGDTLVISPKPGTSLRAKAPIVVQLEVGQLAAAELRGSGRLLLSGLHGDRFELSVAGSGDAQLSQVEFARLVLSVAGSGNVTGQGKAGEIEASIAGSGDLRLADLASQRASISIAGSGDARIHATESLSASIAGSGDVRYSGHPAKLQSQVAGSGRIRPDN